MLTSFTRTLALESLWKRGNGARKVICLANVASRMIFIAYGTRKTPANGCVKKRHSAKGKAEFDLDPTSDRLP